MERGRQKLSGLMKCFIPQMIKMNKINKIKGIKHTTEYYKRDHNYIFNRIQSKDGEKNS